ncbi:glycine betaine ABC transporter substrate-binding protein [Nocardia sp. NPDC050710]|uniref:glycine betaine ABC transporter substrate-binding protein n=1 Tax=Nocardia sp. NPDC050710 TaxID=3157220 RepID=UPI0033C4631B
MTRRMLARFLVVTAAAVTVSCGSDEADPSFVIGAGDSVESGVLAEIYAGALARTGLRVSVLPRLGNRADYLAALDDGRVALVGEHSGALLAFLDSGATARTPAQVTEALNRALPEGWVVADPADGTDLRPRVLLPTEFAVRENVRTIAELAPHCAAFEAGLAPVPGLLPTAPVSIVGCGFARTLPLPDPPALRKALLDGGIQAGVLSGPLAPTPETADGLTVVSDEDYALPAENVLPVFRKGVLDDRRVRKLNYVAGELTTDELVALIQKVREGTPPAETARVWLDAHAL